MILPNGQPLRWNTPGARYGGTVEEVMAAIAQQEKNMNSNRLSIVISDQDVTALNGHLDGIETLLNFLISRPPGDDNVMLGDKSAGFDEKTAAYMGTNPEYIPSYLKAADILQDRTARAQFMKFLGRLKLLASKGQDTFDVLGNQIYTADLGYYHNVAEAGKRGSPGAEDIYDDLAKRYPGHTNAQAKTAAKKAGNP